MIARAGLAQRGLAAALIALCLVAGACSDDEPEAEESSTTTSLGPALPATDLVAICLTAGDQMQDDLCTVAEDGSRTIIRTGVDSGTGVALSEDGRTIAFVSEGQIRVIGVDGTGERGTGLLGTRPEWVRPGEVAAVTDEGRRIWAVQVETKDVRVLVERADRPVGSEQAVIETFAIDPTDERLVATFFTDGGEGGTSRFSLAAVDLFDRSVTEILTSERPIAYPDFSDQGALAVSLDADIHLVDEAAGTSVVVSPPQYIGIEPGWSADGDRLVWLADGVGTEDGPAVLVVADVRADPAGPLGLSVGAPRPLVGSRNQPFDRFPVFPDW